MVSKSNITVQFIQGDTGRVGKVNDPPWLGPELTRKPAKEKTPLFSESVQFLGIGEWGNPKIFKIGSMK